MTKQEYKKEITAIFRRNTRSSFVDWRYCGRLYNEIVDLLYSAEKILLKEQRGRDLFEIVCAAYVKWAKTDKDDSNGETQDFVYNCFEIWDKIYDLPLCDINHEKMFEWFAKNIKGELIDYMEDYVLEYMMDHFKEAEFQERKVELLDERIKYYEEISREKNRESYEIRQSREYQLKIFCETGRPISFIRDYAYLINSIDAKRYLADFEIEQGNLNNGLEIYRELASNEQGRWGRHEFTHRLKELYNEYDLSEEYAELIRRLLYLEPGNSDTLKEYKGLFGRDEWPAERDRLFESMSNISTLILPWYEDEGCYDLLMAGVDKSGSSALKTYEKCLINLYPERCLAVLVRDADEGIAEANNRREYRKVCWLLKRMYRYPGGREKAAELAQKYRMKYPRRTAMLDELEGIL